LGGNESNAFFVGTPFRRTFMRRPLRSRLVILVALGGLAAALFACGEREQAAAPEPTMAPEAEAPAPAAEPTAPVAEVPAAPAPVAKPPTIEFEIYKAGFIVGVSGGKGRLHYQGRSHPVTIAGVSVGATAGFSKADLIGEVEQLHRLGDIEGTYSSPQAGLTLGGGRKVARLENSKGVVLHVRGKQMGIELALDLNGMQISLAK
jgi:hypothetical protein